MQSWLQKMSFALTVLVSLRAAALPAAGSRAPRASGLGQASHARSPGARAQVHVQARVPLLTAAALGHRRAAGEVSWKSKPSSRHAAPPLLKAAPPTIELVHLTTHATYKLRADSLRGGFSAVKLRALAQLLRCHHTGKRHAMSERLIQILYATSRHYHNAKLFIVAGYRAPKIARQKGNPKSPHKRGVACDFQVAGVKNEEVRDYLRSTYPKIGLGYYPRSGFVHVDVGRKIGAYWIDYSAPGERARYGRTEPAASPTAAGAEEAKPAESAALSAGPSGDGSAPAAAALLPAAPAAAAEDSL